MDTRKKIVDRTSIPAGDYLFVSGTFDPLTAEHARRLSGLRGGRGGLVVVIHDPARPILPARARAELVAALAMVDYVVIGGDADVSEDEAHASLQDELIRHVARRHQL